MTWVALSRTKHFDKGVRRKRSYVFTKQKILAPVCNFELREAVASVPLFFVRQDSSLQLCACMGLKKNENLFVNDDGSWLTNFVPAFLRVHPFALGVLNNGNNALLVEEDSEMLVERNEGDPIFDEQGTESEITKGYLSLLINISKSNAVSQKAFELIEEYQLLEPFTRKFQMPDNSTTQFEGLLGLNVPKFHQLEESKFLNLRKTFALDFLYAHLYSLGSLRSLVTIFHAKLASKSRLKDLGNDIFGDSESDLDFNFD